MSEQFKYQVNPLEKISQIEDKKVQELCKRAVEEAIKMTTAADSTSAITQRLSAIIDQTVSKLAKED